MTIAIDISQIVYGTGVSVYTKNLVENLLEIDQKNQYLLFGGSLRRKKELHSYADKLLDRYNNVSAKILPIPPTLLSFIWNRLHILPIENFIGDVDVFLSSDWAQPPAKHAKLITIVHDLVSWRYPETQPKAITSTHYNRMKWIKKEVDAIIADSQSTKKDLVGIIKINPDKIHVIYPGLDRNHFKIQPSREISRVKRKYGLSRYILTVGTREPRKNFSRIVKAFKKLNLGNDFQLAIVGKYGWGGQTPSTKHQTSNVKLLGYVPDDDLAPLYSGAECFVYPSLYEGFGLPVLEAMACGCPVITSDVSSLPEVAGKGALFVNPRNVDEIACALDKIITDKKLTNEIVEEGRKQAKKFSWQKTAEGVLKIIHGV